MHASKILPAALIGICLAFGHTETAGADWQLFKKPLPARSLGADSGTATQLAQAGDAASRVNRLEEQLRLLNGQIEDLTFQLLQLQEELRRMQEDNELRFQELESRRGITGKNRLARSEQQQQVPQAPRQEDDANRSDGDSIAHVLDRNAQDGTTSGDEVPGLEPRALGTLTFDENGNVIGSEVDKPIDLTRRGNGGIGTLSPDTGDAARPPDIGEGGEFPDNPDELYDLGYGYVQAGEYEQAARVFDEFAARYQDNERIAEARFWLGESLFAQGQYEEAARVFLDTHKQFPQGRMAPQTLLKLGVSLAGMNQRELACATFAEVPKKYPDISNAVKTTLVSEQKAASCLVN